MYSDVIKIIRKSIKDYSQNLDLLLIDGIAHYILIKNIKSFISENDHIEVCRNCLNVFYSVQKYNEHEFYCKKRKPKKLMPSFKKYLKFDKLQNCYLNNWNIVSDFECVINKDTNQHEFYAEVIIFIVEMNNIRNMLAIFMI